MQASSAILASMASGPGPSQRHPNELDRRRILRALARRTRYRYVSPEVTPEPSGYRVVSPCCSRNIDRAGGKIDIARFEYDAAQEQWRLYARNHAAQLWVPQGQGRLHELLGMLNEDPKRIFWQ